MSSNKPEALLGVGSVKGLQSVITGKPRRKVTAQESPSCKPSFSKGYGGYTCANE